jgi:hypothetical protein
MKLMWVNANIENEETKKRLALTGHIGWKMGLF